MFLKVNKFRLSQVKETKIIFSVQTFLTGDFYMK